MSPMKPRRRRAIGAATAAAAVTLAGVSAWLVTHSDAETPPPLARFSSQGVTVTITAKDRSATRATLVATFAPQRPGFHLYSVDLPADGVQGIGRPIRLTPQGPLHRAGALTADAEVTSLQVTGLDLTLPVYPDGPVTVELPVSTDGTGPATVLVSYAACSATVCLPPVTDHPIELPEDVWHT